MSPLAQCHIKALHISVFSCLTLASPLAAASDIPLRTSKPSIIADIGGLAALRPILSPEKDDAEAASLLEEVSDIERFLDSHLKKLASDPDLARAVGEAQRVSIQLPAMTEAAHRRFLDITLQLARSGKLDLEPGELRFLEAYSDEMNKPVFLLEDFRKKLAPDAEATAVFSQLEAGSLTMSSLMTRTAKSSDTLRDAIETDPEIDKMTVRLSQMTSQLAYPAEILARAFNEEFDKKENTSSSERFSRLKQLPDAITVRVDRQQQRAAAAALRPAYAHSFVGLLCLPAREKAAAGATVQRALSEALNEMLASIRQRRTILAGQMKRTAMLPTASPEILSAKMEKIDASLSFTRDPALLAWIERTPAPQRPPRITVSSGLIERLCKSVDPAEEVHALASHLEQLAGRPPEVALHSLVSEMGDGVSPTHGETDPGLLAIAITRKELAAALGVAFILAHELGHALFDEWEMAAAKDAAERKMFAELRSDVFALLNADASGIFGFLKRECNVAIQTGRRCHAEGQQLSELVAPYSFDEFFTLFQQTEFAEGDAEHPPVAQRFELLYQLYMTLFVDGTELNDGVDQSNPATRQKEY